MTKKPLTDFEKWVLEEKGTEPPGSGLYLNHVAQGFYCCKKCDAPLYSSEHKFQSTCGWPSFDDEIKNAISRIPDQDGSRTEILCRSCNAHLGHVFQGESLTRKNLRHCVNSISLRFRPKGTSHKEQAIFASGCFWGTEYFLARVPGVLKTEVGYIGGHIQNPTYEDVCSGQTGHVEAVRVFYEKSLTSYESLAKIFFETHDFSQEDGQGPDIGPQYRSQIFPQNAKEEAIVKKLVAFLTDKKKKVATTIKAPETFWPAEDYHQQYYEKTGQTPYCHSRQRIFD